MANTPFGLAPVRYHNGSPYNGAAHVYFIPSTDGNAYAIGDPVMFAGSADASGRCATVVLATGGTGNSVLGCIIGGGSNTYGGAIGANPTTLETTIIPATKTRGYYVLVADDPNLVFEIQEDSIGNNLAATDVGNNFNLVSGANNGFISGWQLDSSTAATTNTLQLKVLGLSPKLNNAIGTNGKWLVMINNHALRPGVAGV